MPLKGGPVNNPTVVPDEYAAADVPLWPLCTVQVVPLTAVTTMISEPTRIRNEALGKGEEEATVREVRELVALAERVVVTEVLEKSAAV